MEPKKIEFNFPIIGLLGTEKYFNWIHDVIKILKFDS